VAVAAVAGCAPTLSVAPHLVATWPMPDARLPVAKQTLELVFNRPLAADSSWAEVIGEDGSRLPAAHGLDPNDPRRLSVRLVEPTAGNFDLRWHVLAADSHLASDGDQTFTLEAGASTPPHVDVSPASAEIGERLELVGKGLPKNSPLRLTIGDDDQPLATAQTDGSGRFNLEARVPQSVPFGLQRVSAFDGPRRVAETGVQVQWGGWPPLIGSDVGRPGPGPGEVTFTLQVRNRSDYVLEQVRLVLRDPDGSALVSADPGAQREGATLVWDIPVMDRGPANPVHVTYSADRPVVSHAWFEFRHRRERGCVRGDCLPAFISNSVADSEPVAPDREGPRAVQDEVAVMMSEP
jgi:methionine-rich copper-binding protein CopC